MSVGGAFSPEPREFPVLTSEAVHRRKDVGWLASYRRLVWFASGLSFALVPAVSPMAHAASAPTLREGAEGAPVRTAESDLKQLGYYTGNIDGIFGPELLAATEAFQRAHGLVTDGVIGPATWGALDAALNASGGASQASPTFEAAPATLELGDQGDAVKTLQTWLDQTGAHLAVDGDFGPLTYQAVRLFQAEHGLPVTGVADAATLSLLQRLAQAPAAADPAPVLGPGATGSAVAALQTELQRVGYSPGGIDGIFGPETERALIAFQSAHGLTPTGTLDAATEAALNGALAEAAASAEPSRGVVSATREAVVGIALRYDHWRYAWGGASPATGFDCSGFVQWVFSQVGVSLPRTSFAQWDAGPHVSYSALQPGDLVFFTTGGVFADHVGIYLGDGNFISATTPEQGVVIQNMGMAYWAQRFDGGVRLLP
ncbi:MAG: peptidoglycan-binding protein [Firmicutes bacterium]|nr:peptidoglycan-binding protein [Alicyclobacillaceae bacterium]MCL6496026.1 peptidoglycan-binding protein [Bacillota bacterium]